MSKRKTARRRLVFSEIEDLRRKGYSQVQIADMFGVSRQAITWQKRTYGGFLTPRQQVNEHWPWKTTNEHNKAKPYQHLRNHGEYIATGGEGMSVDKKARLIGWWAKLRDENVVVEFDPEFPPIPGTSPAGGFKYVPRLETDGDLIIRVNEHTHLTDEGKLLWSWPPEDVFRHKRRM